MLVVDILLIGVLVLGVVAGVRSGFLAGVGALVGIAVGAFAAGAALPVVVAWVPSAQWRGVAGLASAAALLALGALVGSALGRLLRRGVDRTRLRVLERLLGGLVGALSAALAIALVAPPIAAAGFPVVSAAVGSSLVVRTIDQFTPPAIGQALAQVRGAITEEGIPRLGELLSPAVVAPEAPVELSDPAVQTASESVARISGIAYACGTNSTGTGFVAATGLLVTNAHVVAGVDAPVVEVPGDGAREGRVVYFDPDDDIAVIAVAGLQARALPWSDPLSAGSAAVFLGYPYGGPLSAGNATVLSQGVVPVPDIYDASQSPRDVYFLEADVRPGNSGGPLLTSDGTVAGVVFARGADDETRGYAIAADDVEPALSGLDVDSATVGTGRCAQ